MGNEPTPTVIIPPDTTVSTISFQSDVIPIFNKYGCIGCHGGSGGLNLGTVNELKTTGIHTPVIVSGNGAGSILITKMRGTAGFGTIMPPGNSATENEIAKISLWIDQGAKDN